MKNKSLVIKVIIAIALIIIVILSVLLFKYVSLYKEESNYAFGGYYINKNMQITNRDLQNHNRFYEQFCVGKYDYNYILNILEYINKSNKCNYNNKYYQVDVLFNSQKYDMIQDNDYNDLSGLITNEKGEYNVDINYNKENGFINLVTIKEEK